MSRRRPSRKKRSSSQHPRALFSAAQQVEYDKCLAGKPGSCDEPAIRAHSIQNSPTTMGLIARDGHVVMFQKHVSSDSGLDIKLKAVGHNKASTFAGLCARHDNQIFRPLDAADFDPCDQQQLFLLAYRALLREQQVLMTGGLRLQWVADQMGTEAAQSAALQFQLNAFLLKEYRRTHFDPALESGDYGALDHDVLEVPTISPTVAVSSLFSLDEVIRQGDVVRSALSVLPISLGLSFAVLSYTPEDAGPARGALREVLNSTDQYRRAQLSRLIIERAENFVLSPAFVDSWDRKKKEAIIQSAHETVFTAQASGPADSLVLFSYWIRSFEPRYASLNPRHRPTTTRPRRREVGARDRRDSPGIPWHLWGTASPWPTPASGSTCWSQAPPSDGLVSAHRAGAT